VLISLPVAFKILCHQLISCWARVWKSASETLGFWPIKRFTSLRKALRVKVIDSLGTGEGIFHPWALSWYAAAILSDPMTQQLHVSPAPWPIPYQGWVLLWELYPWEMPYLCFRWYHNSHCVWACCLSYMGSAPCCKQAKLLGTSSIWSKHAVVLLSTMITCNWRVSVILYARTLVIARSIALLPGQPRPWWSVIWCAFLLLRMKPLDENHLRRRL